MFSFLIPHCGGAAAEKAPRNKEDTPSSEDAADKPKPIVSTDSDAARDALFQNALASGSFDQVDQSTEEIEIQEIEFQQTSQDEDEPTRAKADIHAIVAAVSSAKSEVTASTKTDDDDDAGDVILIDEVPTN
mmetsp:Transcript_5178/g.6758  ORF Transcript_5178/g.6758 Transcript_5178/m.6758 type:complete len:132 (+) Transcript_5178:242-637(+)